MHWAAQAGVLTPWRSKEGVYRHPRRKRSHSATESSDTSLPSSSPSPAPVVLDENEPMLDDSDDPAVQCFLSRFIWDPVLPIAADEEAEEDEVLRLSTRINIPNTSFNDYEM